MMARDLTRPHIPTTRDGFSLVVPFILCSLSDINPFIFGLNPSLSVYEGAYAYLRPLCCSIALTWNRKGFKHGLCLIMSGDYLETSYEMFH